MARVVASFRHSHIAFECSSVADLIEMFFIFIAYFVDKNSIAFVARLQTTSLHDCSSLLCSPRPIGTTGFHVSFT